MHRDVLTGGECFDGRNLHTVSLAVRDMSRISKQPDRSVGVQHIQRPLRIGSGGDCVHVDKIGACGRERNARLVGGGIVHRVRLGGHTAGLPLTCYFGLRSFV